MSILDARGLRRAYGPREVLRGVDVTIAETDRVGLVGRNGAGKSTLIRVLAGVEAPDAGELARRVGLRVELLQQEPVFAPGLTAEAAVLEGMREWTTAMAAHDAASEALARGDDPERWLAQQARAAEQIERLGGWGRQHEARTVMEHLGVVRRDAPVATLSGGEARRVALARLLVAQPDLAILDEPTNHLDLATVEWLEDYLVARHRGALILVTHDRYLLDRVATRTWEIDDGVIHEYDGGWSRYLEARAERMAHLDRAEANRRNFLRRELEWLRRSPAARTTKQKARVARAEQAIAVEGPKREVTATIELGTARAGRVLIEADHVQVRVGELPDPPRVLLDGVTLRVMKGERLGIVGPNGCGKTTLLRTLLGELPPAAGEVRLGATAKTAVLDQRRSGLDPDATVFEAVAEGRGRIWIGELELEVRSYLERFAFDGAAQRQKVATLSGGERARLALARALRDGVNVVVLDEPTNDLDAITLSALEESLLEFPGALLLVTHDRWFLDRIATSLLVFERDGDAPPHLERYEGGYADYLAARDERLARRRATAAAAAPRAPVPDAPASPVPSKPKAKTLTWAERREYDGLEAKIEAADAEVQRLEAEVGDASFYARAVAEQQASFAALEAARTSAAALMDRWSELAERAGE